MMKMVYGGEVEAYNFPQGSLAPDAPDRLPLARRARKVGLGTFVDPAWKA